MDLDVSFDESGEDGGDSELMNGLRAMGLVIDDPEEKKKTNDQKKKKMPEPEKKKRHESTSISDLDLDDIIDDIEAPKQEAKKEEKPKKIEEKPKPVEDKPKVEEKKKEEPRKPAGRNTGPAKKRPPRIQPISIEELGIEVPKPKPTFDYLLNEQPPPPQKREKPASRVSSRMDSPVYVPSGLTIESRITDYLNTAVKAMISDFTTELNVILQNSFEVGSVINDFVADLRKSIRQSVDFQSEQPNYVRASLNGFDSYAPSFIETMDRIRKLSPKNETEKLNAVRTSRATISARIPALQESLTTGLDSISQEISDLQTMRSQILSRVDGINRRSASVMRNLTDLEVREITQRMENGLLIMKKNQFDSDTTSDPVEVDAPKVNNKMRGLVKQLKETATGDTTPSQTLKRKSLRLADMIEELNTMRKTYEYQHNQLCERCHVLSTYTWHASNSMSPVRESNIEEFVTDRSKTELSISNLKSRLEQVQKEREDTLQSVSSLLEEAKKPPKHRRRSSSAKRRPRS